MHLDAIVSGDVREAILGYDSRVSPAELSAWGDARRRTYLLRDDVDRPLSVDVLVWPSVFGDGLSDADRVHLGVDGVTPPSWRGPNQNLWDDLDAMREACCHLPVERRWDVCVCLQSTEGFGDRGSGRAPYLAPMAPPLRAHDWQIVGFDVADAGLISGLSNCGYSDSERAEGMRSWADSLNSHHLFLNAGRASEFMAYANRRVPEHAPFFVYAIYRIPSPTSPASRAQKGPARE